MDRRTAEIGREKPDCGRGGSGGPGGGGGDVTTVVSSSLNESDVLVGELMELIETVGSYCGYRKTQRKECLNMVRRLNLLIPLLEEIMEIDKSVSCIESLIICLNGLKKALLAAKKLLKHCNYGSKIYLALEGEAVMQRFHGVYEKLNQALDDVHYDELGISVEVKEFSWVLK